MLGYESNNSFTPIMCKVLSEMGHIVTQFSIGKVRASMGPGMADQYLKFKRPFPLSQAIFGFEDKLDILHVVQSYIYWKNDLERYMPLIYLHTELSSPLTCYTPTHIEMRLPEMNHFLHSYFPWQWNNIPYKYLLYPSAHPLHYDPDYKKDLNISFVGPPSNTFDRIRDYVWNTMSKQHTEIKEYYKRKEIGHYIDHMGENPSTFPQYNMMLARSEHMVLTAHRGVYLSRRMFECLASKTIPILYVENDKCKEILRDVGFLWEGRRQNCYTYRKKEDLDSFNNIKYDENIAENGYNLLLENHTFNHRALKILKQINLSCGRLRSFPIPEKEEIDEKVKKEAKEHIKL